MNFEHYDLGYCHAGECYQVFLTGSAANIRLMDDTNFHAYRRAGRHSYVGGLMRRSPAVVEVPHSGRWHITVDLAGMRGSVKSHVSRI